MKNNFIKSIKSSKSSSSRLKFLMVASYPESIIGFRGALIESIQSLGIQVHILFPNSKNEETCVSLIFIPSRHSSF